MINPIRLSLGQLSWLVILLIVGILAAGAFTRTHADSPEVISLDDFSGQISVEPVATLLPASHPDPGAVPEVSFETEDRELPQQDQIEVVVVELEPVDVLEGDAPQLDPSQGLQVEREEPSIENSAQDEGYEVDPKIGSNVCTAGDDKPCPLGCDAVPAKGLCGQYYDWWYKHHQHEWAVNSDHFECVPNDIDFKVGCLWPSPAELLKIQEYLADPAVQAEMQVQVQELSEFLNQVGQDPSDTQDAPDPAGLSDEELRRRLADPSTGFDEWKVLLKEFRSRQQGQSASAAEGGKPATVQDLQDQIEQLKRELAIKELWRQYRRAQDRASQLEQELLNCLEDLYTDTAVGLFTFGIGTLVQEIFGGGAGNRLIDCVKLKGEYDAANSGADQAHQRWKTEAFRR